MGSIHLCFTDLVHNYPLTVHTHASTLPGPGDNKNSDTTKKRIEHISNGHEIHMRKHITEVQFTFTNEQSICAYSKCIGRFRQPLEVYVDRKNKEAPLQTNLPPN